MTSDFLLAEADDWRPEAWDLIHQRPDVMFFLLTKRPERVADCLPHDWGDGWNNVWFNVTCENQRRADERIPILLEQPFKHKGLHCAPLLGPLRIGGYLDSGQIEQVACGGENYGGRRPCDFDWVRELREECVARDITFCFMETGTTFIKDGKEYFIKSKQEQNLQAYKSGMNHHSPSENTVFGRIFYAQHTKARHNPAQIARKERFSPQNSAIFLIFGIAILR
jgi:protein gp37